MAKVLLSDYSPCLPVLFDKETLELDFSEIQDLDDVYYSSRQYRQLSSVFKNANSDLIFNNETVYWMYRHVQLMEHRMRLHSRRIRYDISVYRPGHYADELMKTHGHFHPYITGSKFSFPEFYEVLYGDAIFLLQGDCVINDDDSAIRYSQCNTAQCVQIECSAGDRIVVPPNFGHVTVNLSSTEPLVTANWVCAMFNSDYSIPSGYRGFAFYHVPGDGGYSVEENPRYRKNIELLRATPRASELLGVDMGMYSYKEVVEDSLKYRYLVTPRRFESPFQLDDTFTVQKEDQ